MVSTPGGNRSMSRINTNIESLVAQRALARTDRAAATNQIRLATGQRINAGRDDPAGLVSGEALRAQLAQLEAETRSLERADAVARVADSAAGEMSALLAEAEGKAVALANSAGFSEAERDALRLEYNSLVQGVDRIAQTTSFNGERVFRDETVLRAGEEELAIGRNDAATLGETAFGGETLSLRDTARAGGAAAAGTANGQAVLDAAAAQVAQLRGQIGAFQSNQIGALRGSLNAEFVNTAAARSAIVDLDYAAGAAEAARLATLSASGAATLGLANSRPEAVLGLLGA